MRPPETDNRGARAGAGRSRRRKRVSARNPPFIDAASAVVATEIGGRAGVTDAEGKQEGEERPRSPGGIVLASARRGEDVKSLPPWVLAGESVTTIRRSREEIQDVRSETLSWPGGIGRSGRGLGSCRPRRRAKMDESNECGICLGEWANPVKLPCGHSFCADCLR